MKWFVGDLNFCGCFSCYCGEELANWKEPSNADFLWQVASDESHEVRSATVKLFKTCA